MKKDSLDISSGPKYPWVFLHWIISGSSEKSVAMCSHLDALGWSLVPWSCCISRVDLGEGLGGVLFLEK